MKRGFALGSCAIAVLLLSHTAQAAVVEVDVTIKSVDAKARGLSVTYEAKGEKKTIDLDVSRKAEITVNEKAGTLEAVKPGQKAKVSFEKELQVVTKIDATGDGATEPGAVSLVQVAELQGIFSPCLSEDGLTIYYSKEFKKVPHIYTAHRKDADSLFENERLLFEGWIPAVTNDGLEMIFCGSVTPETKCFYSTTRESVKESFKRPKPIPELRDPPEAEWSRNQSFSSDGLTLYFHRIPEKGKKDLAFATRPDRKSPWSKPQPISMNGNDLFTGLTCPVVTDDGMTMLCTNTAPGDWMKLKGNLLKFTRTDSKAPFANPKFVEFQELPKLIGRYPCYVPATKELFFLQADDANLGQCHLIIIKNFVP